MRGPKVHSFFIGCCERIHIFKTHIQTGTNLYWNDELSKSFGSSSSVFSITTKSYDFEDNIDVLRLCTSSVDCKIVLQGARGRECTIRLPIAREEDPCWFYIDTCRGGVEWCKARIPYRTHEHSLQSKGLCVSREHIDYIRGGDGDARGGGLSIVLKEESLKAQLFSSSCKNVPTEPLPVVFGKSTVRARTGMYNVLRGNFKDWVCAHHSMVDATACHGLKPLRKKFENDPSGVITSILVPVFRDSKDKEEARFFKKTGADIDLMLCVQTGVDRARRLRFALSIKAISGIVAAAVTVLSVPAVGPLALLIGFAVKIAIRIAVGGKYVRVRLSNYEFN